MSSVTIENSVYDENVYPKIKDKIKMNIVEAKAKTITVNTLDKMNSFLLIPSIRFCFNVP